MNAADEQLLATWERIRRRTGLLEPIDLIHKALGQLEARTALEALEAQTRARLADLSDEGEQLARRREKADASAGFAAGKRLERLHELVNSGEKELARATSALALSDSHVAKARQGAAALDQLANKAGADVAASDTSASVSVLPRTGYMRLHDPLECDSAKLPAQMQATADAIIHALRSARGFDAPGGAPAGGEFNDFAPSSPSKLFPGMA